MSNTTIIFSERIERDRCPMCGSEMKDKGSYIRCVSCGFNPAPAFDWSMEDGSCTIYYDDGDDDE